MFLKLTLSYLRLEILSKLYGEYIVLFVFKLLSLLIYQYGSTEKNKVMMMMMMMMMMDIFSNFKKIVIKVLSTDFQGRIFLIFICHCFLISRYLFL
jgi:hypothetical protein